MPHTYNGCGTWYYGRSNASVYPGVCSSCGAHVMLESYDTRLWIVIVMVPVVPLARKRIIEKCPRCTRHRAMPLQEYQQACQRVRETVERYRQSPHNVELAREAVVACAGFRDAGAFDTLADEIMAQLPDQHEVLLLVGAGYRVFGDDARRERFLRAAYDASDCDATREALAELLINTNRTDESIPYLQHIVDSRQPDKVDLIYSLAQRLQSRGRHDEALTWFEHCEQINPFVTQDPVFQRLKEASQRNQRTHTPVDPSAVVRSYNTGRKARRFGRVAAVLAVLILLVYLGICWMLGRSRAVYLVSGVDASYVALINGKTYPVDPYTTTKIRLPEGPITVRVQGEPAGATASDTLSSGFFTRPFNSDVVVINPDQCAILARNVVVYSDRNSTPPGGGDTVVSAGQLLHVFHGIDYIFSEPPGTIQLESRGSTVKRIQLELVHAVPPLSQHMLLKMLAMRAGKEVAARAAVRGFIFNPESASGRVAMDDLASAQQRIAALQPLLADRPVEIEIHRAYQTAMEEAGQFQQMQDEYNRLVAAEPDNSALLYLSGRIATSVDGAAALYEKALKGPAPCQYALVGVAHRHLVMAEYSKAEEYARKAVTALPPGVNANASYTLKEALIGARRYNEALEILRQLESQPFPLNYAVAMDEVELFTKTRRPTDARAAINRLLRVLDPAGGKLAAHLRDGFNARIRYLEGDENAYAGYTNDTENPDEAFIARLASPKPQEAATILAQLQPSANNHLVFYLAASRAGQDILAREQLARAVTLLKSGPRCDTLVADALTTSDAKHAAELVRDLLQIEEDPGRKALLLAVVGLRVSAAREECFRLARALNYHDTFNARLINWALNQPVQP